MRPVTLVRAPAAQTFCLQSPITQVVCRHSRPAHGRVMPPAYMPGGAPPAAPPFPAAPPSVGLKVKPGSPPAPAVPALPPLPPPVVICRLGHAVAINPTKAKKATRRPWDAMSMLLRDQG